jgi:alpha-D-xyloside xylohydrolase
LGNEASFLLHEDTGDGYNYEDVAFSTIEITWDDVNRQLILGKRNGKYPGMPEQQVFQIILHDKGQPEVDSTKSELRERIFY